MNSIRMTVVFGAVLAMGAGCQTTTPVQHEPVPAPVVFVCEHGNVKSLIAASLFDQAARERGLPFRAVSRGLNPEPGVPPKIAEALRGDGIDTAGFEPRALSASDIESASRVIAIGVDLPAAGHQARVPTELWNDVPPASLDYAASRAVLQRHIDQLLDQLQANP